MLSVERLLDVTSSPRRWRWSVLFLLCLLPFAVPAQISDAKVEALVEALRLSAPRSAPIPNCMAIGASSRTTSGVGPSVVWIRT